MMSTLRRYGFFCRLIVLALCVQAFTLPLAGSSRPALAAAVSPAEDRFAMYEAEAAEQLDTQ